MDKNDQREGEGEGKAAMEGDDWRIHLTPEMRARVVNKVLEKLQYHSRTCGKDVSYGLDKITKQLEEKVFSVASSQENYVRGIASKLLLLEGHYQGNPTHSFPAISNINEVKDSTVNRTDNVLEFVSGESTRYEPMKHLIAAVRSISPEAMKAALCDISVVVQGTDRLAGSQSGNESRSAVGQDLGAMAVPPANSYVLQDRILKRKPAGTLISSHYVSSASSGYHIFDQFTDSEIYNHDSTAACIVKKPRYELNHALLEEVRRINRQLVDIVLYIMDHNVRGWEGTLVKCFFNAMSFSSNLKAHYVTEMALIQPLFLQVPSSYPNCSPKLLENFQLEISEPYDDLSLKTRMRLSASLQRLSEPLSLWEIASTWESCIHAVILEYVQQFGGGSFSSKYGTWNSCIPAV